MSVDFTLAWKIIQQKINLFVALLPNLIIAIIVLLLFWLLSRGMDNIVERLARKFKQPQSLVTLFSRLARWATFLFGIMVALTIVMPSLNASSIFSALGVGSVAIGFAFKDIFQNWLAGILLLVTRPFIIGDQIITENHEGTVKDILVRATIIETYDNKQVVVPNSELFTNRVTVITANDMRRLSVQVILSANDDIEAGKALIIDTISHLPDILKDPPITVIAKELQSDFSVVLNVNFWIDPPRKKIGSKVIDQVICAIQPALLQAGFKAESTVKPAEKTNTQVEIQK